MLSTVCVHAEAGAPESPRSAPAEEHAEDLLRVIMCVRGGPVAWPARRSRARPLAVISPSLIRRLLLFVAQDAVGLRDELEGLVRARRRVLVRVQLQGTLLVRALYLWTEGQQRLAPVDCSDDADPADELRLAFRSASTASCSCRAAGSGYNFMDLLKNFAALSRSFARRYFCAISKQRSASGLLACAAETSRTTCASGGGEWRRAEAFGRGREGVPPWQRLVHAKHWPSSGFEHAKPSGPARPTFEEHADGSSTPELAEELPQLGPLAPHDGSTACHHSKEASAKLRRGSQGEAVPERHAAEKQTTKSRDFGVDGRSADLEMVAQLCRERFSSDAEISQDDVSIRGRDTSHARHVHLCTGGTQREKK
eukprot:scaffold576_cov260-Pinguiococcus_pyrenoidosus.AAC.25